MMPAMPPQCLPRTFFEAFEDPLDTIDVAARLLEMRLECRAQIGRGRRLRQLRQCLGQLFFGVVAVSQFVQKRIVQGSGFGHDFSLCAGSLAQGARGRSYGCVALRIGVRRKHRSEQATRSGAALTGSDYP